MIALYVVVLAIVAILVARPRAASVRRGWSWFAAWAVAGAAFTFSFLAGFSIGLFVLPVAAAALVVVASRAPELAEAVGFAAGAGLVAVAIRLANHDYRPCAESGELTLPPGTQAGAVASCGGVDPVPWLLGGGLSVLLATGASAALRRRG